ncbi:GSU3529 family protein [Trichlorobacter ammonificans]|uniref:Uncharacterized protein n=1 Tax=Trichlorobacter ammonificans TaxID=2916410 RepID=A0ABM9DDL4_9BACT|nr:hypothetical protein [Trichlorobacter ammonificans]CAH2032561.1 conserved protein of unknown function [Trichlorobacter ammonificans]
MDRYDELKQAVTEQYEEGELPKWLADPVFEVVANRERYQGKEYLIELLTAQLREYDVYAEAGCCKWAYDHEDIKRTLRWLHDQ